MFCIFFRLKKVCYIDVVMVVYCKRVVEELEDFFSLEIDYLLKVGGIWVFWVMVFF